jgi:hypothetical protein
MKLVDNWLSVIKRSTSFWLALLSAALSAAELALPLFNGVVPPRMFATASMITAVLAAIARVIHQASLHQPDALGNRT